MSEQDSQKQRSRWEPAALVVLSVAVFVLPLLLLLLGSKSNGVVSGAVTVVMLGLLAAPLFLWWLKPSRTKRLLKAASWGAYAFLAFIILFGPDFLRSRVSANESATIVNLRRIVSAQAEYHKVAGAYAPKAACLSQPSSCLKEYRGTSLLEGAAGPVEEHAQGGISGYFYEWVIVPRSSGEGAKHYAITATPAEPGKSGVRGFCGDSTGLLCFSRKGEAPPVRDGACQITPATCEVLQ